MRDSEPTATVVRAHDWILIAGSAIKELRLVHPLRLDELELAFQTGSDEDERQSSFGAVVLKDPRRQDRAVARSLSEKWSFDWWINGDGSSA